MIISDAIRAVADEAKAWRHDIHAHPELLFDLPHTAGMVADKLKSFGCDEVVTGIAKSGVVAVIVGNRPGPKTVALRADMDALPIHETTNLTYSSKIEGRMHACGHDGHTAMLLGAAKYLAANRDFAGRVALIFQPAEEGGGGGRVMLQEGVLERFGIDEVYGMHNWPGLEAGSFATRGGPMMAAGDRFVVTVRGQGGHAAFPHRCIDPVLVVAHITVALQSIVSRGVDPMDPVVLTVASIHGGDALNVIAETAQIGGTIRTLLPETRAFVEERFRAIVAATALAHGATAEIDWRAGYPVTVNDPAKARLAVLAAEEVSGPGTVNGDYPRIMGSEDFSYMLEKRPGAIIWIGNGASAELHHPAYDFNDDAIEPGIAYWISLVGRATEAAEAR